MGIINGVTTNPTLIAQEKDGYNLLLKKIIHLIDGPISVEAMCSKSSEIVVEAKKLSQIDSNIVVKIPITYDGLKAINILRKDNIKTNATLIFSANQALLAAKAGATYVSPFIGRLDDIGHDGMVIIRDIVQIFKNYEIDSEIIVASIRHPQHVIDSAIARANIATVPPYILEKMISHPLTDIGITKFLEDWKKVKA